MNNFITKGYDYIGIAPADKCKNILSQIKSTRNFGPDLFLSETDFYSQKDRYGTNPHPGRNIVETLDLNFKLLKIFNITINFRKKKFMKWLI